MHNSTAVRTKQPSLALLLIRINSTEHVAEINENKPRHDIQTKSAANSSSKGHGELHRKQIKIPVRSKKFTLLTLNKITSTAEMKITSTAHTTITTTAKKN
jgi:hypothetical protein